MLSIFIWETEESSDVSNKNVIVFCKQWPWIKMSAKPNNNQLSTIYQGVHNTSFNELLQGGV